MVANAALSQVVEENGGYTRPDCFGHLAQRFAYQQIAVAQ
jgi:hypothetical protein